MPAGILYLDGPRLRRCLQSGLQQLISERDYLNRINVFPVPDGDTGNNLAHTARAGLHSMLATPDERADMTLRTMADAALDGAQGNSGVILAQYMQALATAVDGLTRIHAAGIAEALATAATETRAALAAPRDGTMLSIMDAIAGAAGEHSQVEDFAVLLPHLLKAADEALSRTPEQLAELRKAKVVDSGAHGLCAILHGCNDYLQSGSIREVPELSTEALPEVFQHAHDDEDPAFRFCTECLLAGNDLDADEIRTRLMKFGDSIVVAGSHRRVRLHVHTDTPEAVFEMAADWGEVLTTKADDMQVQTRTLRSADRAVAIVTDSGADIPPEIMDELGIHMVPLRVQVGDESILDKTGLSAGQLEQLLANTSGSAGTSQPTPGDLRRMYEFLATHFEAIVAIHVSEQLSGTFAGARAAAAICKDKISVVNCRTVSVGQGLIVRAAARLAREHSDREKIAGELDKTIAGVQSFALVPDLASAVRSGRLKPWVKTVADLLRLTPILADTPDGKITAGGFLPGKRDLERRFAKRVTRRLRGNRWRIAIAHGPHNKARGEHLASLLLDELPDSEIVWQTEIGAALGLHAGMDALVVAFEPG